MLSRVSVILLNVTPPREWSRHRTKFQIPVPWKKAALTCSFHHIKNLSLYPITLRWSLYIE